MNIKARLSRSSVEPDDLYDTARQEIEKLEDAIQEALDVPANWGDESYEMIEILERTQQ